MSRRETPWLLRHGADYHSLPAGRLVMGRDLDVEIPLTDPLASRRHAELDVSADGVRIRDLGSRNGTEVRGRRLPAHAWIELQDREAIVIGAARLVVLKERARGRLVTHSARALPRPSRRDTERSTGTAAPYETFLAEADRAAARGDLDRRRAATEMLIEALGGALRAGFPPDHGAVQAAVNHALFLVDHAGPDWIGRVFALYRRGGLTVPGDLLARLEALVEAHGLPDPKELERYIDAVQPELAADPRGMAMLRQLERIRRLSGA